MAQDKVTQQNEARVREFVEVVQRDGGIDRIDDFLGADFVNHTQAPMLPEGIEGARAIIGAIRQAFPDHDAEIVHMIAKGDTVATHKTHTGTHDGEFFGIPPTGKRVTLRVMDWVCLKDGMIVEHWALANVAEVIEELQA